MRRLPRRIQQSYGVIHHRLHAFLGLLRRAVVVDVEHVEEEQAGFLGIEFVDVHGLDLR